jgi:hypothetical protein
MGHGYTGRNEPCSHWGLALLAWLTCFLTTIASVVRHAEDTLYGSLPTRYSCLENKPQLAQQDSGPLLMAKMQERPKKKLFPPHPLYQSLFKAAAIHAGPFMCVLSMR